MKLVLVLFIVKQRYTSIDFKAFGKRILQAPIAFGRMDLASFCTSLPKLELHAHLNGSLSAATLNRLYKMHNPEAWDKDEIVMNIDSLSSLGECFKVFDVAHSLTTTPEAVYLAAYSTIKEFKEDNVIYLELRSTPRSVPGKMTKQEYIESLIKACEACKVDYPEILVKLLVSVNRKQGSWDAKQNVDLAIRYAKEFPSYVAGIDLSGDPMTGDAFIELLQRARAADLKIAAHCAEIPNEKEAMDILRLRPDRLGHCTCVHPDLGGSERLYQTLLESRIPVELCPTSNVKCKTVPSYERHQFGYLYQSDHPICVSTDDKGVFNTSLSREYEIIGSTFRLTREQLRRLSASTVQYSFASDEDKRRLSSRFQ